METIGVQEMAQRLGVTPQTVYNYIDRGLIPSAKMRRGLRSRIVVLRADFDRVYDSLTTGPLDRDGTIQESDDKLATPSHAALSLV